ncbi:MAG: manganese efflux pump, partial [Clostridia bacterium]|nr:manganese efflux pump [Clostridia bacterium]
KWIEVAVPIIGFCILFLLGAKMIVDSVREIVKEKKAKEKEIDNLSCPNCLEAEDGKPYKFGVKTLLVQSVATSIDALTVGLVYIGKSPLETYVTFALIAVITFGICIGGVFIGQKFGDKLKSKSGILGGLILIAIGLKLLIEFLIERF